MLNKLLDRPVSVSMVLLVFVVLGTIGICRLPVSLIPDVDVPYITVQVTDNSLSAQQMEESVVNGLRTNLSQIDRLKDIHSESKDGASTITLYFEEGSDIDYYFIEVNEKIDRAMGNLRISDRPKVFKASASDIPAFYINITLKETGVTDMSADPVLFPVSDAFRDMSSFSRNVIARRIEQLPEVAMVDISGTVDDEILVIPDEDKLHQCGMDLNSFKGCLSSANVSLSNLTIRDGEYHYNVKFKSFARSADDIADIYLKIGDRVMQVRDVARVIVHPAARSGLAMSRSKDAVILAVIKQNESRMSELRDAISAQLNHFAEDYPQLDFELTRDQTELLEYSIRNLLVNIILAILLDCLIIFLFMKDFKSPLLVSLTIPVSLIVSFFVFYLAGMTINIISLSGLLLGIGMMVDNTIILVDNITARWQRDGDLRSAVIDGTREVSGAMLSSVLTTCAVFIPLVFLNGLAGELFYDQAITITVVLLVSYFITVLVMPVFYWVLYRKQDSFQPNRLLSRIRFSGADSIYDRIANWFISNGWTSWVIPVASLIVIGLCVSWMPKSKLPPITYSDAILKVDWNDNITLDENRARITELEIAANDLCVQTTSLVGLQQFVLNHCGDQSQDESSLYFKCSSPSGLERAKNILSCLIAERYPNAIFQFSNSGNIFEMVFAKQESPLVAKLQPVSSTGMDVARLNGTLDAIRASLPGIEINSVPVKRDILYVPDPELMNLYGVAYDDLAEILYNALNGNKVFDIVQGNRRMPVVLGTDVRDMDDILSKSFITINNGKSEIPVSALMKQSWDMNFKTRVSGKDGEYYPLELDVKSSEVAAVMETVTSAVRQKNNFGIEWSGSYFSNIEMVRQMALILLIAVTLLFLILASQFESLIQPVIILSEVLIDIAVCLCVLWICGVSINLMSLIGLVVICGIVINDSILKIDTINRLLRQGMELNQSIHEAGHRRLKAIIMTSVTTILAVAPFLSRGNMGDDLQYPMALVIIIGMTIGTLVSLFYVPAIYAFIYRNRRKK